MSIIRKIFVLIIVSSLFIVGCSSNGDEGKDSGKTPTAGLADGTYTGQAEGHNGPISVEVTIANEKISNVTLTNHVETTGVCENAIANTTSSMIDNNSYEVDTTAGATITSVGIKLAVKNALEQAGADLATYSAKVEAPAANDQTLDTDVVVIGAGGGGITAAVRAAQLGASVILIEKNGQVGGDTALNAGTLIATGSKFQTEKLKETNDSPELAYEDIMKVGKNANDPNMVTMITNSIGQTVDWLVDEMKVPYDVAATQYPDHSANRQIGVVGRSPKFLSLMEENFKGLKGNLLLETRATELVVTDGAVTGVVAVDKQGNKITINAKSTVLASGGYGADTELLPNTLDGYMFYGRSTNTGDGLKMGTAINADTINLEFVKVYAQGVETVPNRALAATASSTAATKGHGAIYVNTKGERVVNEEGTLGEITEATVAQDDKVMYLLMDEEAYGVYINKSLEDKLVASEDDLNKWYDIQNDGKPVITKGDLSSVATTMGIDGDALLNTVTKYNEDAAAGKDAFNKENPVALAEGTYYLVEQKPRFSTTLGGLKADVNMAIFATDGNLIPNLFGAGSVVGGGNGKDSMTAMMNSWAIGSGRVAGESAFNNLK